MIPHQVIRVANQFFAYRSYQSFELGLGGPAGLQGDIPNRGVCSRLRLPLRGGTVRFQLRGGLGKSCSVKR